MAVFKNSLDIYVKNEEEKNKVLSIINSTQKPTQDVLDRFSKAMNIKVEEKFLASGK